MLDAMRFRAVSLNCLSLWSSLPSTRLPISNSQERKTITGKRLCTAHWMLMRDRNLTRGITLEIVISRTLIDLTRVYKWALIAKEVVIKVNWGLQHAIRNLRVHFSHYCPQVCQAHRWENLKQPKSEDTWYMTNQLRARSCKTRLLNNKTWVREDVR